MKLEENKNKTNLTQLLKAALGAAIGVQSEKNRQKDFSSTSIFPYVVAGLIFTTLFVFTLIGVVHLVLTNL